MPTGKALIFSMLFPCYVKACDIYTWKPFPFPMGSSFMYTLQGTH